MTQGIADLGTAAREADDDNAVPVSLRDRAILGSTWTLVGYGGSQVLRLGSNLVLAWLLFPEAFGLMALVKAFMQGLQMFSDLGIGPSIIQNKRGADPDFRNTAWTFQVIRGFVLWVCTCILAWPAAWFFSRNDPIAWQLLSILPVAGLTAMISGFNSTALFTLTRRLALGRLTLLEVASQCASIVVMISWAIISPTVWALVAGGIAASLVRLVASHRIAPGEPVRFGWDPASRVQLLGFGKWIFLSTLVTFLAQHLDKLTLGRMLTLGELGLYSIGLVFARVAIHMAHRLSNTVIFPALCTFQDDPRRVVRVCLESRRAVLWVSGGVCVTFAVAAPLFFDVLYDDRYKGAGEIARWLSIYVWACALIASMDRIHLALGHPRRLLIANAVRAAGILMAIGGYQVAALPGFILGMTVSALLSLVYLVVRLPAYRVRMARQTTFFTGGFLVYAAAALALIAWVEYAWPALAFSTTAITAVVPAITAAIVVLDLIRRPPGSVRAEACR